MKTPENPIIVKDKLDSVGCGFCLAKWTQVTIHLGSGINHSCHHVKAHKIDLEELKRLLKSPTLLDAKNIFSIEKLKSLEFKYDNVGRNF